jgi:adenine-specific DNA-methyltransferase
MQKLDAKTGGSSLDLVRENVEELRRLFPSIVTEEGVDFDALRGLLGDEVGDLNERYSFTWAGKQQARRIALTPSAGTLRPCSEESVDWATTQNLFIEGDNLEVLKLLQKSYHKKVKLIYIDPPYNTGNDFIYPDDYRDNLATYLRYTGQVDEEGFKTSANAETSGRYHTRWLNMMYPRLKLARNLLRDDGAIFVSIDDHEVHNLRHLLDELFGPENFIATVIWQKVFAPKPR